jgi:dihydroorotase
MGASTGNMLVDDPAVLERLFACAPAILITHCEDTPSITVNEEKWRKSHGDAVPFSAHPLIRDAEACYKSSSLAVALARKHDTRLHVLHISTAANSNSLKTSCWLTSDHRRSLSHLLFDDRDYATLGSHQMQPAVKAENATPCAPR